MNHEAPGTDIPVYRPSERRPYASRPAPEPQAGPFIHWALPTGERAERVLTDAEWDLIRRFTPGTPA